MHGLHLYIIQSSRAGRSRVHMLVSLFKEQVINDDCSYSPRLSGVNRNTTKMVILHILKIVLKLYQVVSILHPYPTKLQQKNSRSYTNCFFYVPINPKTVPIHPSLRYVLYTRIYICTMYMYMYVLYLNE